MSVNDLSLTLSDQSLLKHLQSKKAAEKELAWEYAYKMYYPMVREAVCKNNGTEEDATDIFQDGLLILHRNLYKGTFREESSIKTYIFGICRNLWLKELKKRQKHNDSITDLTVHSQHEEINYLINVEVVTLLMNELKEDCRRILTEYYYNNKSMAELKEMFNVNSIQAAKNKKLRCMGYLVRLCKERGITPYVYP